MTTCLEPSSRDHDGPAYLRIGYMQAYVTAANRHYLYCAMIKGREFIAGSKIVLAKRIGADYGALVAAWDSGWMDTPNGRAQLYGGR